MNIKYKEKKKGNYDNQTLRYLYQRRCRRHNLWKLSTISFLAKGDQPRRCMPELYTVYNILKPADCFLRIKNLHFAFLVMSICWNTLSIVNRRQIFFPVWIGVSIQGSVNCCIRTSHTNRKRREDPMKGVLDWMSLGLPYLSFSFYEIIKSGKAPSHCIFL